MSPGFIGPDISASRRADGTWTLNRKLVYQSAVTGRRYTVPRGFNTDFASVPRLPVAYVLTGNTAHQAAALHDYLYRTGAEDRTTCDAIFREAMAATGIPGWRAWMMWVGVRLGGRRHHVQTTKAVVPAADEPAKVDDNSG